MNNIGAILQNLFKPTWTSKTETKPEEPPKKESKYNELTVVFTDSRSISWNYTKWEGGEDIWEPWKEFKEWYTKGTDETFTMAAIDNGVILNRKNIMYVSVRQGTK